MIIALFALAVFMIVGGIASVLQGWIYVRLESGLAMVIAGATVASAGAVLLGIAALAARLRAVEQALGGARGLDASETLPQRAMAATRANPRPVEPSLDAGMLPTGPMAGTALAGLAAPQAHRPSSEPVFEAPADSAPRSAEPSFPDLLPGAQRPADPPDPAQPAPEIDAKAPAADDDGPAPAASVAGSGPFTAPEPVAVPAAGEEPVALRSSLEEALPDPAPEMPPAEPELQVVGTYASGGNTYVMYSNGSIEAETPRGRFSFNSLDELKAFVDAGGESESRGAA